MKTAIVPIIKNKTGNSDKNNYRPIALVTAASKNFELCLSFILEDYLITHDQQFGFKRKYSTDLCIFTVKSVTKYYTKENSPVYICFLDASKAFDKINHYILFRKLLDRKTPIKNNLAFNSSKSFCMVFKPRLYKLSFPSLYMSTEKLEYTNSTKYLGFTFSSDKKDDNDMLRQLRILYTKSNRIPRLFNCCSIDVELALFRSYCACFYCPYLWTHYMKSTHSKLKVAFNNVYRRILKLPPRSGASTMYTVNLIDSFEVLVRKRVAGFIERLKDSNNSIIFCIDNSWKMKFDIWDSWIKLIFK